MTEEGAQALAASSVLDAERVRLLLERLSPEERRAAVAGLDLLAREAREIPRKEKKR